MREPVFLPLSRSDMKERSWDRPDYPVHILQQYETVICTP